MFVSKRDSCFTFPSSTASDALPEPTSQDEEAESAATFQAAEEACHQEEFAKQKLEEEEALEKKAEEETEAKGSTKAMEVEGSPEKKRNAPKGVEFSKQQPSIVEAFATQATKVVRPTKSGLKHSGLEALVNADNFVLTIS